MIFTGGRALIASNAAWPAMQRRVVFLPAERAAGGGLDHADLALGPAQRLAQRLAARSTGTAGCLGSPGLPARWLQACPAARCTDAPAPRPVLALDHESRLHERGLRVAAPDIQTLEHVVGAVLDPVGGQRRQGVQHGRQRLILDANAPHRAAQSIGRPMRQQQDRLVLVAEFLRDEDRLIRLDESDVVRAGDVAMIDDDVFVPGYRAVEVDPGDAPSGGRRRTVAPCSIPSARRSSTYFADPCSLSRPSTRGLSRRYAW